ncbi:MAG: dephospho-CoA kinase [Nitriliruptoraceae bacterium]
MKLVGLTGGIGSGKSTVGRLLATHGAVVCDVDVIAREILSVDKPALSEVRDRFGDDIFHADGSLDRQALAAIVFPDPVALNDLEQITHPHIAKRLHQWICTREQQLPTSSLAVVDHPLLIETQDLSRYDAIVVVTCDDAVRRERLITQRGLDPDDVAARIAAQTDDVTRRQHATHVIDNSTDQETLVEAVAKLYETLTSP